MTAWATALAAAVLSVSSVASTAVFSFADDRINESSGLVDLGRQMVTTNDSGGDPQVFLVDSRTGRTVSTITYADQVEDVEALAPAGPDAVWVGDIGDNRLRRSSIQVYRVPVGEQRRDVRADAYELVYPDGAHDAESMVQGPDGRLRIITKSLLGGRAYVAPKKLDADRPNKLVAGPVVDIWATDAALFPDGKHALVRGYGGAVVTTFPGFETVAEISLPPQEQGEGVSIASNGRIRLSSEGVGSEVLQIRLPAEVVAAMAASGTPATDAGLDADGVVDSDHASGLQWRYVLIGAGGVLAGWLLVRRLRG